MVQPTQTGMNIGDVVRLASGGHDMTVSATNVQNGTVTCIWFDGNMVSSDSFPEGTLTPVETPALEE